MKAKELIGKLKKAGWTQERQKGSHVILKHPEHGMLVVPDHGAKDLGPGLLKAILKQARLK